MADLLTLDRVTAGYGRGDILHAVSLSVQSGEVVSLLGANGAGKTTTLRAISGMVKSSGQIAFDDQPLHGKTTSKRARLGIAHLPAGRGTFLNKTVKENLRIGALQLPHAQRNQRIDEMVDLFPKLGTRANQVAGTLSGGEQQMLAIARAVIANPRLLLVDEPSLGLAPIIVKDVFEMLHRLNSELGTSMLIVEQNAAVAMAISHRVYLLQSGSIVQSGDVDEMRDDSAIRSAYLGV